MEKYMDLRKLYSIDEKKHKELYEERFNSPYTVKLNFEVNNKTAFFVLAMK